MKKVKKIDLRTEPSEDEKAFVYQQTLELSPLLRSDEPITVILQKLSKKSKAEKYTVTFVLIPSTLNIKIQSQGSNLYDVCIDAKNKAKKAIAQLMNQSEHPYRKRQMEHFKKYPYLQ